jgi:hypothetical protein
MSEVESVMTTAQYSLEPEELAQTALAVGPYLASKKCYRARIGALLFGSPFYERQERLRKGRRLPVH